MEQCFAASRYGKGDSDYINCPMNKEQYDLFADELVRAERAPVHSFDAGNPKVYEDACPSRYWRPEGTMPSGSAP